MPSVFHVLIIFERPLRAKKSVISAVTIFRAMPVKHIVIMKFKSDTSPETLQEAGKNLVALKGLLLSTFHYNCFRITFEIAGKVPGILDISFGPTFKHDRAQGFTHALVVDLADASALEVFSFSSYFHAPKMSVCYWQVYATHPEHVSVITNNLKPNFEAPPLAMDYEF